MRVSVKKVRWSCDGEKDPSVFCEESWKGQCSENIYARARNMTFIIRSRQGDRDIYTY